MEAYPSKKETGNMSKQNLVDEIHKPCRRNFLRRKVIMKGIDDLWQADLVEMGAYADQNKGYRYLLTVIDTFSKFGWAVALKDKTASSVSDAMQMIFAKHKRIPKNLQTDDGKEFFNITHFSKLMKKHNINHYSTFSVLKASIVERFNRTIKSAMWKQFSYNGSYKWIEMINTLIDNYNSKKHRTIKMCPRDVNKTNENRLLTTVYEHIKIKPLKTKFILNDCVRISKYKHLFAKGYTPNYTTEVFKIAAIQPTTPVTYILTDYKNQPISGAFYEAELCKAKYPDVFLVEKIVRKTKNKFLVKWLGFGSEHNSWISRDQIISDT